MTTSRADLHCHSTASEVSKLGVQRSLGLPECATPPEEVYSLAKRRGMDFVTITDHDTIDGVLSIADRPDVFISEELTARFKGEPQAVHILCLGITPDDHEWLQAHADDVEVIAEYLRTNEITASLAHPFYAVEAPLQPRHRRRLAQLFDVWEVRNGSRAPELNHPAAIYVETHGGTGTGGSDDHAGVDIGRTWSETPAAATPQEFLAHIRAGHVEAMGEQGSAAKWAHAAMALAIRALGRGDSTAAPDPAAVLKMVERVMTEGDARAGSVGADLGPEDGRALLRAWLDAVDLRMSERELLTLLQSDGFSHAALERRARRCHERGLERAVAKAIAAPNEIDAAAEEVFTACVAAIPYAPAAAFLGREKSKLARRDGEPLRVALVADGIGGMHGVTHTLDEIRERGVPGFEVEVIGTDPHVDRRLSAVAEVDIPFYAGLRVGVPSLPAVVEALSEGRYDVLHLCSPGPAGVASALIGKVLGMPITGSYHTELTTYTQMRSGDQKLGFAMEAALTAFYGACDVVLSPSAVSDQRLRSMGIDGIGRWDRGVDVERFSPTLRARDNDGKVRVMYAGRLTKEKGVDLLADAFLAARARDPRLELVLAGGGPEEEALRSRLGSAGTFLGWLEGDGLARAYADSDLFLFCSQTDTFGQVVLEAQASGLPVVAVAAGGPVELIDSGRTGMLCPASASALADAVCGLAASPPARARLARGGLSAVRERTWEASMAALGAGWMRSLAARAAATGEVRAA
ncbi:glycosyltransferase [Solirubrobacter sp. CPCC 204708]|uniref:Glycosyltransferase n=1 Tax=Solirubrobacter deserti TaxID=2282478 RepID=A0ABT4RRU2_9ACTN|nr:glycosyltransferase [Solirubrobacter deserti]MBE2320096.1 glycosyltransferase [Solirubrobacter deserti]MDA0140965.1 glycosyltransferase [Solirubrobacter deserti]